MTSRIIANQKHRAALWARQNFPGHGLGEWGDNFTALLLEKDLEVRAAVFYNSFHPDDSVDMHVAALGRNWLNRPFLRAVFRYPFIQLNVRRVGALVSAENSPSLRFVRHLGFTQEGIAREAWGRGVDTICFGMLKRECRYLSGPEPEIWSIPLGEAVSANSARSGRDSQRAIGS